MEQVKHLRGFNPLKPQYALVVLAVIFAATYPNLALSEHVNSSDNAIDAPSIDEIQIPNNTTDVAGSEEEPLAALEAFETLGVNKTCPTSTNGRCSSKSPTKPYCPGNGCCSRWYWCGTSRLHCLRSSNSRFDGKYCTTPSDPCKVKNGNCSSYATCTNVKGKPVCQCRSGYIGNGSICIKNACLINNGGCGSKLCNMVGSKVSCTCKKYYKADKSGVCRDVNECLVKNGGCSKYATCYNQVGKPPICRCNKYFTGDGKVCNDIDECKKNNGGCSPFARCINLFGRPNKCQCTSKK